MKWIKKLPMVLVGLLLLALLGCSGTTIKKYSDRPRTEIYIKILNEGS